MLIDIIAAGWDNYSYVISEGRSAAVVDPGDAGPVLSCIRDRDLSIKAVFITHHHGDHSAGAGRIKKETGCAIVAPGGAGLFGGFDTVRDGDMRSAGSIEMRTLSTPGHTANDMCWYAPALDAVFTGDTMFVCGCGRLFGAGAAQMWQSLNRIAGLGDNTLVYCGHEYTEENLEFALSIEPDNNLVKQRLEEVKALRRENKPTVPSPILREKQTNPFLRACDPLLKKALGMSGASDVDVFAELRRRKDRF
jgi:hydroxyacylglutathione hydrolase